ncbi:FxSxx-COOH system tetratricopeptide repeat protein [Streptomyces sp. NPDC054783]
MVRWTWRKDNGSGTGAAPAAQAGAGDNSQAPPDADSTRPPMAFGPGGTWQEVFQSGNATATGGGIAVSGIYTSTVQLPPEALRQPADVDAPPGLDDLPHRPGHFVGRGSELDRLDAALAVPGAALVQAVHGLGGIGKSTLAAYWAATRPHGRAPIRWITADSPAAVRQGLADLATALQPVLAKVLPDQALAEWGLQWLASHTDWLIVLDNVNDPAHIAALIARARGGRFLITSRLATVWSDAATLVRLDVLEPAESLALLTRIATSTGLRRDLDGAADLCTELGHLPLAIEQAAAYLAQNPLTTPRTYLELLARDPAQMYRHGAATTPAERTIARVWNITLDRITDLQPEAADLLRTLAWYAPEHIPTTLAGGPSGLPALDAALGLLTAYNMITPDPDTKTLAVHRLVQALTRTPDPDDPHRTPTLTARARDQAAANLHTALPTTWDTPATWPTWRTLLPHIDALTDHTTQDTDTAATADILNLTGCFLNNQGQPARAIRYHHRALADWVRVLGADHLDTLHSRSNLAYAYRSAGDLGRAIPLYEQTLTDAERVLGEDHPDTLIFRNNLAYAYQPAGDLGRAIPLFEQTLTDSERVLGEDHPSTLTVRDNLAYAYRSAGDLGRAIPLYKQNLTDRVRVLGENHPDTLNSRNNLAGAYRSAGDLGRAIPLFEQNLTDRVRVLGDDHPDTLASHSNLACAYESAGDPGRAIPLFEQALINAERVLGEDHPSTLTFRNNLAGACQSAGHLDQAIPLYKQNLSDAERVLGEDHPSTLGFRNNLAGAYQSAGDPDQAIPLYEQALTGRVRVLGEDHPSTLTSRNNLAYAYQSAGDLSRAIPLFEQTLANDERVLGEDHPDTLASRNNLAYAYDLAGDLTRAIPLFERTLTTAERVLGEGHPITVAVRENLTAAIDQRDGPS